MKYPGKIPNQTKSFICKPDDKESYVKSNEKHNKKKTNPRCI